MTPWWSIAAYLLMGCALGGLVVAYVVHRLDIVQRERIRDVASMTVALRQNITILRENRDILAADLMAFRRMMNDAGFSAVPFENLAGEAPFMVFRHFVRHLQTDDHPVWPPLCSCATCLTFIDRIHCLQI